MARSCRGRYARERSFPSENELSAEYGSAGRRCARHCRFCRMRDTYMRNMAAEPSARRCYGTRRRPKYRGRDNLSFRIIFFPRIVQGIDQVLTENGYSILLKNTRNSRSLEGKVSLEELLQKDIDGLIIEPSKSQIFCRHVNLYEMLDSYHIPYVFIQEYMPSF